jgi:large subunit ribosomal protein L21e
MPRKKKHRNKGKFSFTRFFQKLDKGDNVAVVEELSIKFPYKRLQGKTGKVISKQGAAYKVEIKDFNKPKLYLIRPVHLRRME